MPIRPIEVSTFSKIPSFVPFGVEYFTQDTADLYVGTGASSGPAVTAVNGGGGGIGTVTSVSFTGDGTVLSATPSAVVTTAGSLQAALANANANTVLGNTTGSSAAPAYGQVVNGQIANATIDLTAKVTGVLPPANGGTALFSTSGRGGFMPATVYGNAGIAGTIMTDSASKVRVAQFWIPFTLKFTKFTFFVNTAIGGSTGNMAIYDLSGNLLVDSGSISTASSSTAVGATVSQTTLTPGAYWLAWSNTSASVSTNNISIKGSAGFYVNRVTTHIGSAANALSAGAMPPTLGVITADGTTVDIPNVLLEP